MNEHGVHQRIDRLPRMPPAMVAALVAGLVVLACSSSGLKNGAGDAGTAKGGQGGSIIGDLPTGGSGGAPGAGGVSLCLSCAAFVGGAGGHCDASPSCNPGDIPVTSDADCLEYPNSCYVNEQCGQVITCRHGAGASVDAGGSNGNGGTSGSAGTSGNVGGGGTGGSSPLPIFFPICNPGDQQVASGIRLDYDHVHTYLSGDCPAGRECYSVDGSTGPILCMLPEGLRCADSLFCNPGDTEEKYAGLDCTAAPNSCYQIHLCNRSKLCLSASGAGAFPSACSGVWSNGFPFEPPDASAASGDSGAMNCCGDGILQAGEQCDMGNLNGVPLGDLECTAECRILGFDD